jgi:hypothetical protein
MIGYVSPVLTDPDTIHHATPLKDYAGYVAPALTDPDTLKYLSGVGLQQGFRGLSAICLRASDWIPHLLG